jgi:hypothetical protein
VGGAEVAEAAFFLVFSPLVRVVVFVVFIVVFRF